MSDIAAALLVNAGLIAPETTTVTSIADWTPPAPELPPAMTVGAQVELVNVKREPTVACGAQHEASGAVCALDAGHFGDHADTHGNYWMPVNNDSDGELVLDGDVAKVVPAPPLDTTACGATAPFDGALPCQRLVGHDGDHDDCKGFTWPLLLKPLHPKEPPAPVKKKNADGERMVVAPKAKTGSGEIAVRAERMFDYIAANPGCGGRELRDALGINTAMFQKSLRHLDEEGRVVKEGPKVQRRYFTTESKDAEAAKKNGIGHSEGVRIGKLYARVTEAVAENPGDLDEHRLALALQVEREDIAIVCGDLIDKGYAVMRPDGCYALTSKADAALAAGESMNHGRYAA